MPRPSASQKIEHRRKGVFQQNRCKLSVHQGVDEGRVAALLRTSIIAACTTYAGKLDGGEGNEGAQGPGFEFQLWARPAGGSPQIGSSNWRLLRPHWRVRRADEGSSLVASTVRSRPVHARVSWAERAPRHTFAASRHPSTREDPRSLAAPAGILPVVTVRRVNSDSWRGSLAPGVHSDPRGGPPANRRGRGVSNEASGYHFPKRPGLVGGGSHPPGEISLAHQSVPFLDELPEFTGIM
jgi:hypothetical protein